MAEGEVSGTGYARQGDKVPDYVPLLWSDPDAIRFDASQITFKLLPTEPEPEP